MPEENTKRCVLSLYNTYAEEIFKKALENEEDDTTISVKADTLHQATHLLHEVQTAAKHWFAANKLVLNEEKTERIVFSLRDCGAINGELTDIRFLGVTIDPTLKWNVHIDNMRHSI
nr:unnamed protein product [Callosobruchus analis]